MQAIRLFAITCGFILSGLVLLGSTAHLVANVQSVGATFTSLSLYLLVATAAAQVVGVQDEYRDPVFKPYRFFDLDGAMRHLMACSGVALRGDCGLEQVH